MERELYNILLSEVSKFETSVSNKDQLVYGLRKKVGSHWDELYKISDGKVIISKDQVESSIRISHRENGKCLSLNETSKNFTSRFAVTRSDTDINRLSESFINNIIKSCPFCIKKVFEPEKPVLLRWSNGLIYKGYVLAMENRLCFVELDNYSTAVLDVKDVFDEFEHEVMCSLCTVGSSDPPNEIVLCDCCNTGYHQKCHKPVITDEILNDDNDWFCRRCLIAKGTITDSNNLSVAKPAYNYSTLACMSLLDMGPSLRSDILSWIQRNFSHYKERKSDRWKAKVSIAMSISRHWIMQDRSSGLWNFVPHMTPALLRHLSRETVNSKDLPVSLREKIPHPSSLPDVPIFYSNVLSYEVDSLTWDKKHRSNKEGLYCYCLGNGVWYKQMLQCLACLQWFHQACITCISTPLLCGERRVFVCGVCNLGEEYTEHRSMHKRDALHLAMYHVTMTRYHGDFTLAMCLRMNVLPLVKQLFPGEDVHVWDLADTATENPHLFQTGTKNTNTTLYRLLVTEPPEYPPVTLVPPLPPSSQLVSPFLPPGFVTDLSNDTSGLQVDGSPPIEDYPPTAYDVSIFKDIDYYGTKQSTGGKEKKIKKSNKPQSHLIKLSEQKSKRLKVDISDLVVASPSVNDLELKKNSTLVSRIMSGEKYKILGLRKGTDGKLEYLIAWEGVKARFGSLS